ncbi:hepcidin [Rhinatrema bivittatum]|uniref:hepcidin n=1 Tax=Rhinatrema bivittatum TaxID=194408 RepID=UPI00112A0775|nr:hepcidin [Rhinatrema bivittatum]
MKLTQVCVFFLCSIVILSSYSAAAAAAAGTQEEAEEQPMGLSKLQTEEPSSLLMARLRTKRQSHLNMCRFCCGCCKNKGCSLCCRT